MVSKLRKYFMVASVATLVVACGDKYVEPMDTSFSGTWRYESTSFYTDGKLDTTLNNENMFLVIRDNMILYYSDGTYDSSFVYRLNRQNIYGTRTKDEVRFATSVKKVRRDSLNNPVFVEDEVTNTLVPDYERDENGNILYEEMVEYRPARPTTLPPPTGGFLEQEIAIYSVSTDNKMHFKYYKSFANTDTTKLLKEIVLVRPIDN